MKRNQVTVNDKGQRAKRVGPIGLAGLVGLMALLMVGCAAVGSNPTPPSKFESLLFNTQTNEATVTAYRTNTVVVQQVVTNTVAVTQPVTNTVGVVQFVTNQVPVPVVQYVTNQEAVAYQAPVPAYTETPKDSVKASVQAGGAVLNTFAPGIGSLVSAAIMALLGGWGYVRSSKASALGSTSSALAQEMEAVLEFVKALPNGPTYVGELVDFLQKHQTEAGVASQVLQILENEISNPDAKVAANQVIQAINALKATTQPLQPISS